VHFEPGSLLLLYTDGLVERRGVGVEQGLARLEAAASSAPADLSQLCDHILAVLLDRDRPVDDVALLAVQPASLLGPRLRLQYAAESVQLVALRRTLQRWLTEAGADPSEAYEVIVATSEAATNAIEHAYGPAPAFFEVSCEFRDGVVEVSVRDRGVWRSSRGLGRGRGRGLTLIEGLMDEVDIVRGEDGSTVTFRRALARPAGVEPVRSAEVLQ
jgi:anti-sigma regulatory factor (Ser/Thr protein kinase)